MNDNAKKMKLIMQIIPILQAPLRRVGANLRMSMLRILKDLITTFQNCQ